MANSLCLQLTDDVMTVWHNSPVISLLGLEGHTVRCDSTLTQLTVENAYRGWYIDDFSIGSYTPPTCGDLNELMITWLLQHNCIMVLS